MASMSEFLSGFNRYGESVLQTGAIDPNRQRPGLQGLGSFGLGGGKSGAIGNILKGLTNQPAYNMFGQGQQTGPTTGLTNEQVQMILDQTGGGPGQYGMFNGQLTLNPNDFVFSGPEMFARLLQQSEMDGGFLSDASQNAAFAGQTAGAMNMLGAQQRAGMRQAQAAGLNPIFAERQALNQSYDMLGNLLGQRAQLRSQLGQRQFEAQQAFTNMMAQNEVAEKEFRVNTMANLAGAQMGAEGALAGGKAAGKGSMMGGLLGGIGAALGGI